MTVYLKTLRPELCLLFTLIIVLAGCGPEFPSQFDDNSYDYLKVKTSRDDSREVILTDLTGGFFFSGVSDDSGKASYGYSRFDKHFFSGWDIFDDTGNDLRSKLNYCIVEPQRIERHYRSGLIETIETPLTHEGLIVTIEDKGVADVFFRPIFDFRYVNSEFPETIHPEFELRKKIPIVVSSDNPEFGSIAIAVSHNPNVVKFPNKELIYHPRSYSIGRPWNIEKTTFGEISLTPGGSVTIVFGWGSTSEEAVDSARLILKKCRRIRAQRGKWIQNVLSTIDFHAVNNKLRKSFALARLQLAGMNFTNSEGTFLHTALPFSPFPDGWFTAIAAPGISEIYNSSEVGLDLISSVLEYQNRDTSSVHYGMLPGKIYTDSVEYRVPFISGLMYRAFTSIKRRFPDIDTTFDARLQHVFQHDNAGTAKYRTIGRTYYYSDPTSHFLWDSPAAPLRQGFTFESEGLSNDISGGNYDEDELSQVPSDYKPQAPQRKRVSSVTRITGELGMVEKSIDSQELQNYLAEIKQQRGSEGNVRHSLIRDSLTGLYTYTKIIEDNEDVTSLPIYSDSMQFDRTYEYNQRLHRPIHFADKFDFLYTEMSDTSLSMIKRSPQMTQRVVQPFIQSWLFTLDGGDILLNSINRNQMAGQTGLRSLTKYKGEYQPKHLYHMDACPYGTTSLGDVLVWTAGCLGDLYLNDGLIGDYFELCEKLSEIVIESGVIGGLPEANDGETQMGGSGYVWSPVHSASLAEYVRLITQGMFCIQSEEEVGIYFRPEIPKDWGNYRIEYKISDGNLWIERYKPKMWQVGQRDIEPYIKFTIDLLMPPDQIAKHSVRIYPGECLQIEFINTGHRLWKAEQRQWKSRKKDVKLWGLPDK